MTRTPEDLAERLLKTEIPFTAAITAPKGVASMTEEHLGDTFGVLVGREHLCLFDSHRHYDCDVEAIPDHAKGMLMMTMPVGNGACMVPLATWIFSQLLPSMNASKEQLDLIIVREEKEQDEKEEKDQKAKKRKKQEQKAKKRMTQDQKAQKRMTQDQKQDRDDICVLYFLVFSFIFCFLLYFLNFY